MASTPSDTHQLETHVFRLLGGSQRLESIAFADWEQIVQHARPLEPANAAVRLLLIKGSGSSCKAIEALKLQTDNFGFLLTWDASSTQSLPRLKNAAADHKVIDSRELFLQRYLSHRHSWQPSTPLLAEALARAGYT